MTPKSEGERGAERDTTCGLCGADADWAAFTHDRHTGACRQHVAWACNVLQSGVHVSTEVTVRPRVRGEQ